LLAQHYPHFEVIVVDDRSTDSTARILDRLSAADARVRAIYGEPLPEGWIGKPWRDYFAPEGMATFCERHAYMTLARALSAQQQQRETGDKYL